jgi:hypothetical protein
VLFLEAFIKKCSQDVSVSKLAFGFHAQTQTLFYWAGFSSSYFFQSIFISYQIVYKSNNNIIVHTAFVVHASCNSFGLVETAGIFLVISTIQVMEVCRFIEKKE